MMQVRRPRLLSATFGEAARLEPESMSLTLQTRDTSFARITLADGGAMTTAAAGEYTAPVSVQPAQFAPWKRDCAFMEVSSAPAFSAREGWDVYRYLFARAITLRLDALTANGDITGVYVAGYMMSGTAHALSASDIGTAFDADALIINCRRTLTAASGTASMIGPTAFTALAYKDKKFAKESDQPAITDAEGWEIWRMAFGERQTMKVTALGANSSVTGCYPAGYELDGTYYPIEAGNVGEAFEADALILNAQASEVISGGASMSIDQDDFGSAPAYPGAAFLPVDGSPARVPSSGYDVFKMSLGAAAVNFTLTALTPNASLPDVYPLAYELDGAWFPLTAGDAGKTFRAEALLLNALRETTMAGDTPLSLTGASFGATAYLSGYCFMPGANGEPELVQRTGWAVYKLALTGGSQTARLDALTANDETPDVYPMFYLDDGAYHPLTAGDAGYAFTAEALLVNYDATAGEYSIDSATVTPGLHEVTSWTPAMTAATIKTGVYVTTTRAWSSNYLNITTGMTPTEERDFSATGITFAPEAPDGEKTVAMHDWAELYTPNGSAGLFRVTGIARTSKRERTLTMMHAIDTLSDDVWPEQIDYDGYVHQFLAALLSKQTAARWQLGTCADTSAYKRQGINYTRLSDLMAELLEARPDHYLTFDFSTSPWTLNFVALETTISSEFRLSRNVETAQITRNDAEMCNRLYLSINTAQEGTIETLIPRDFSDYHSGYYISSDGTETALSGWKTMRRAFSTRTAFRLAALSRNDAIQGGIALAYERDGAYYPLDETSMGRTYEADALLINYDTTLQGSALGSAAIATGADGDAKTNAEEIRIYENPASQAIYGIIEKTADIDAGNVASPDAWAQNFLAERAEPAIQISIDGYELKQLTGDTWDEHSRGRLARAALGSMGEIVTARVESVTYPDLLGQPEKITVELANKLARYSSAIARLQKEARSAGRAARGLARSSASASTQEHLELIVQKINRALEDQRIIEIWESGVVLDAMSGVKIYSLYQGLESNRAELNVNTQQIDMIVRNVGSNGKVTAASIIMAINNDKSEMRLSADRIYLEGNVSVKGILTGQTKAAAIRARVLQADSALNFMGYNATWRKMTLTDGGGNPVSAWFMVRQN